MKNKRALPSNITIIKKNGALKLPEATGTWSTLISEPYYLFLTLPWSLFAMLTAAGYLVLNFIFAFLFWFTISPLGSDHLPTLPEYFFFSIQTFSSIGYGAMYPSTTTAHCLVTLEAMISIVYIALITGLAYARFARPTAKILFSQKAVVSSYEGVPALMLRAANKRQNHIVEASVTLYLMRDEVTKEGISMRRFYTLSLIQSRTPAFSIGWTLIHKITPESPLWEVNHEEFQRSLGSILVSLQGLDETVSQVVHARTSYNANSIMWGYRLADMIIKEASGNRTVDYTLFDSIIKE